MQPEFINHNGKLIQKDIPQLQIDNRGFRYGWGLFETMLVREGSIRLGQYHWDRLLSSTKQIGLDLPAVLDSSYFEAEVLKTVRKNQMEKLARVRLQLYNGNGGLSDSAIQGAGFTIECFTTEKHVTELNTSGLTLGIATAVRKSADILANLKTTSALIYGVATEEARRKRWNDALVLNTNEHIIESTIANIFWIKDNIVYTPPLSEGCIAGVMRRYLMNKLPHSGIIVKQTPLYHEFLKTADEVFLTNAVRGMRWVHSIDEQSFAKSAVLDIYEASIKVL